VRGGEVKGDSRTPGYEDKIAVASLHMEMGRKSAGREEAATPEMELTITKPMDSATPMLQRAMLEGDPVKSATFEFVRTDNEGKTTTRQAHTFSEGMLDSYRHFGGAGNEPMESISASFRGR
jgi:type VI secretion system Hcp family effector